MASTKFPAAHDYTFGITNGDLIVSGLVLESLSIEFTPEFEAEGKDENGETQAYIQGGNKGVFSASGFISDIDDFNAVTNFTYDAGDGDRFYIITRRSVEHSNTDFRKASLEGTSYPNILTA